MRSALRFTMTQWFASQLEVAVIVCLCVKSSTVVTLGHVQTCPAEDETAATQLQGIEGLTY